MAPMLRIFKLFGETRPTESRDKRESNRVAISFFFKFLSSMPFVMVYKPS